MIPLSLITGFLGSGKTTLLQHIVEGNRQRRLVYVVNEFGAVDVDGRLFSIGDEQLVRIPGGSIFCRCLSGEFIRLLRAIPEGCGAVPGGKALDGVLVEASGIADPKVIAQMLEENRLHEIYQLAVIVSVVDPGSFLKLMRTLPNIIAQVEACDLAVINKTDLYGESEIREVEEEVGRINPAATILRSRYCRVQVDVLATAARRPLEGRYAPCVDPNYAANTVSVESPINAERLLAELRAIREEVYRVKGFVPSADGWLHVDLSPSGLSTRRVSDPGKPGTPGSLIFISRPGAQQRINDLILELRRGASRELV